MMIFNFFVIVKFIGAEVYSFCILRIIKWYRWAHVPMHVWERIEKKQAAEKGAPKLKLGGLGKFLNAVKQGKSKKPTGPPEITGAEIIDKAIIMT